MINTKFTENLLFAGHRQQEKKRANYVFGKITRQHKLRKCN